MKQGIQITCTLIFALSTLICFGQTKQERADNLFYTYQQINGPGVSISVSQDNQMIYENRQGYANLEHEILISDSSRFLVASISKQFTAWSILLLEKEGKLTLDDLIVDYLPELKDLPGAITIRMLANHTSGLRNNIDLSGLKGKSIEDLISQEETVSLLLKQKGLNFEPGEKFQYNNSGFVLLAEIIERVSGIAFSEFVKRNIFEPLGMDNSQFLEDPNGLVERKANSYYKRADMYQNCLMNRTVVGSTGLYTTPQDLIKWAQNFKNLKVGNSDMFEKMIAPSVLNSGEKIPYGLGQETKMYRGVKVLFHGGGDAGYRAYLLHVPEYDFSVAVAGNYESFNPLTIAYGMIDVFLADQIAEKETENTLSLTTKKLEKFTGTYQMFPGLYFNIIARDDSLFFLGYNTTDELFLPLIAENTFKFSPFQHSKMVFAENQIRWHFSDFSYSAKKVVLSPPTYEEIKIDDYLGMFYSEELETTYIFENIEGEIVASHAFNPDYVLLPIAEDSFIITASSIFSRVDFVRDSENKIVACKVSSQDAHDLEFEKRFSEK